MGNFLWACLACSCLFDAENHVTTSGCESYLRCPNCGRVFYSIERCPECGNAEETEQMTVDDDEEDGMVFVCSSCDHQWSTEDSCCADMEMPPIKCPHCNELQDFSSSNTEGYREFLRCRCGGEWDSQECPDVCPQCGVDPEKDVPEFHIETGSFTCKSCGRKVPVESYWKGYWGI